jgi:quercetin dioxygenase-like cupin family protein
MPQIISRTTAYKTPLPGQPALSLIGPIVSWLASAEQTSDQFSVLDSLLVPGVVVPLHSHPEVECFYVLDGTLQILTYQDNEPCWLEVKAGESVVVPSNAPHAIRNTSASTVRLLMIFEARLGRFFEEIGRPVTPGGQPPLPSGEWIHAFSAAAVRYGYWLASPEENAAIGLKL